MAYKLALLVGSKIYDVFHVSMLKNHSGPALMTSDQLPTVSDTAIILSQPESILDRIVICKGNYQPKTKILVKWVGAPTEDSTWENQRRFSQTYPNFILADKDTLSGRE